MEAVDWTFAETDSMSEPSTTARLPVKNVVSQSNVVSTTGNSPISLPLLKASPRNSVSPFNDKSIFFTPTAQRIGMSENDFIFSCGSRTLRRMVAACREKDLTPIPDGSNPGIDAATLLRACRLRRQERLSALSDAQRHLASLRVDRDGLTRELVKLEALAASWCRRIPPVAGKTGEEATGKPRLDTPLWVSLAVKQTWEAFQAHCSNAIPMNSRPGDPVCFDKQRHELRVKTDEYFRSVKPSSAANIEQIASVMEREENLENLIPFQSLQVAKGSFKSFHEILVAEAGTATETVTQLERQFLVFCDEIEKIERELTAQQCDDAKYLCWEMIQEKHVALEFSQRKRLTEKQDRHRIQLYKCFFQQLCSLEDQRNRSQVVLGNPKEQCNTVTEELFELEENLLPQAKLSLDRCESETMQLVENVRFAAANHVKKMETFDFQLKQMVDREENPGIGLIEESEAAIATFQSTIMSLSAELYSRPAIDECVLTLERQAFMLSREVATTKTQLEDVLGLDETFAQDSHQPLNGIKKRDADLAKSHQILVELVEEEKRVRRDSVKLVEETAKNNRDRATFEASAAALQNEVDSLRGKLSLLEDQGDSSADEDNFDGLPQKSFFSKSILALGKERKQLESQWCQVKEASGRKPKGPMLPAVSLRSQPVEISTVNATSPTLFGQLSSLVFGTPKRAFNLLQPEFTLTPLPPGYPAGL